MQKFPIFTSASILALSLLFLASPRLLEKVQGDDPSSERPPAETAKEQQLAESRQAQALIQQAKTNLFNLKSVQADIRQVVTLGERRFQAEGSYLTGPFPRLRLEYRIRAGNTLGILLEVCDGQILHSQKSIQRLPLNNPADEEQAAADILVTRRDIVKILEATSKAGGSPATVLQAELGLGGLPALLASLERSMQFTEIREELHHGKRYRVVIGQWKPPQAEMVKAQLGRLGISPHPFLPDEVRIFFNSETLFPERILYLKAPEDAPNRKLPLMALEFTHIRINEPISSLAFDYVKPANVDEDDITEDYLKTIRQTTLPPTRPSSP